MKQGLSTSWVTLTLAATVLLLPACKGGPKVGETRWGMLVMFEKDGTCVHLSGPPRIGAYPTEEIVWRIYNKCGTSHKFAISDIRRAPDGYVAPSQATSREEAARQRTGHPEVNPFEGALSMDVTATSKEFKLRVKPDALAGLYTFVTLLDGKPNDDDEVVIWPPN